MRDAVDMRDENVDAQAFLRWKCRNTKLASKASVDFNTLTFHLDAFTVPPGSIERRLSSASAPWLASRVMQEQGVGEDLSQTASYLRFRVR